MAKMLAKQKLQAVKIDKKKKWALGQTIIDDFESLQKTVDTQRESFEKLKEQLLDQGSISKHMHGHSRRGSITVMSRQSLIDKEKDYAYHIQKKRALSSFGIHL